MSLKKLFVIKLSHSLDNKSDLQMDDGGWYTQLPVTNAWDKYIHTENDNGPAAVRNESKKPRVLPVLPALVRNKSFKNWIYARIQPLQPMTTVDI